MQKCLTRSVIVCTICFTGDKISAIDNFGAPFKKQAVLQKLAVRKPVAVVSGLTQIPAF